jgi:hypothetical protein
MNTNVPEFGQKGSSAMQPGVRSATFNLDTLQALAQAGRLRQFHDLSTVSGGGNGQPAARQPV